MRIIGMMSGTSVDGIDVAIVDITRSNPVVTAPNVCTSDNTATPNRATSTGPWLPPDSQPKQSANDDKLGNFAKDGKEQQPAANKDATLPHVTIDQRFFTTIPWDEETRRSLFALFHGPTTAAKLCRANFVVAEQFAAAATQALATAGIQWETIDLIASHGQTIWHDVVDGDVTSTLQIGDPSVLATRTGVTTIGNFRTADVAAAGQGAPLVSVYDWFQLRPPATATGWRAVQNIGGIGNVTLLPPYGSDAPPLAFDTGPGNVLLDWAATRATNGKQQFDTDGQLAARGIVSPALLADWLKLPFFHQIPPKTTGRELFTDTLAAAWYAAAQTHGLRAIDFVATLTELTAATIAEAYARFAPGPIAEVIVAGGGARNPTLMQRLETQLTERLGVTIPIRTHAALGIDDKAKEAIVFAFIAYRTLHGVAGNVPACTGATQPQILGQIAPGSNYQTLMKRVHSS